MLQMLPCLDSPGMAMARKRELALPHHVAVALGRSAVGAAKRGYCEVGGKRVDWRHLVKAARTARVSIANDQR